MNKSVQDLFARQKQERMNFCGFIAPPTDVEDAVLELIGRFNDVSHVQVVSLLEPWFSQYKVGPVIENLVFEGKLEWGRHMDWLRFPKKKSE